MRKKIEQAFLYVAIALIPCQKTYSFKVFLLLIWRLWPSIYTNTTY